MTERYYLDRDNDSHWYVIPVSKSEEWEDWLVIDPDDQRAWLVPDYARSVGGSPTLVSFTNPEFA